MQIGVFDSGKGGHIVASRLQALLPQHAYITIDDRTHVPYGDKDEKDIVRLAELAIGPLLNAVQIIIIACNTVTAIAIDYLRKKYPSHYFIGFEPMIKPLSRVTTHGVVLATSATKRSLRYNSLKETYGLTILIDEPDTTDWALMIERDKAENISFTDLDKCVEQGADTIALSCTHYLALQTVLEQRYAGRAVIIEPMAAISQRLSQLITRLPA